MEFIERNVAGKTKYSLLSIQHPASQSLRSIHVIIKTGNPTGSPVDAPYFVRI